MNDPTSSKTPPTGNERALVRVTGLTGKLPAQVSRLKEVFEKHRFAFIVATLALMVSGFFALQFAHFSHRYDSDRTVWNLPFWKPLETLEWRTYDSRFTNRGPVVPRSRDQIAIIGIDQNSLSAIGQWPWPRSLHAKLIDRLHAAGAKVIAIDVDFSDLQFPTVDAQGNRLLSAHDKALVAAAARAGNVITPSFISFDSLEKGDDTAAASLLITPFEQLDETMQDLSLAYVPRESDAGARRFTWYGIFNPDSDSRAVLGSFAGLAVAIAQKKLDGNENKAYETDLLQSRARTSDAKVIAVPTFEGKPARDDAARVRTMLLNYWGPLGSFPTESFSNVLSVYTDAQLKQKFNNKIVFIGATAHILKDVFPIPRFDTGKIISQDGHNVKLIADSEIPGVELHATAAAMMLDGAFIREARAAWGYFSIFALTFIAAAFMAGLRERVTLIARTAQVKWRERKLPGSIYDIAWLVLYGVALLLPLVIFGSIAQWLFETYGLWLISVYPIASAGIVSIGVLGVSFAEEAAQRRKTLNLFARRVSVDVMEELLAHPEDHQYEPRRVQATVLFSDLEGFTTYSENHEPEEVVEALNALFDRLEPIVFEHGGTVDKFIGDAIMAYFGAPVPRFDHAARALHCAIALQHECKSFREDTGIPFYMRVGIHTGEVIVALVGSSDRSDYTVIGDTVNLASRLESKNKEFGSWIMCSSDTQRAAPGVAISESASAQIKGKSMAVDVFIVRGLIGEPPYDTQWGHAKTDALGHEAAESQKSLGDDRDTAQLTGEQYQDDAEKPMAALPSPAVIENEDEAR
jgi:adenylate cyclase